jgi:hypothetical protein
VSYYYYYCIFTCVRRCFRTSIIKIVQKLIEQAVVDKGKLRNEKKTLESLLFSKGYLKKIMRVVRQMCFKISTFHQLSNEV